MKKKCKLFVDAHSFDGGFQGSRSFLHGLYSALAARGDLDIHMGARDTGALQAAFPAIAPGNFIRYRSHNTFWRILVEIPAILKKHDFDYAHFQYVSPLRKYCDYVVTTHDILFTEFKDQFPLRYRLSRSVLFRYCLKNAEIGTTPSSYCLEKLLSRYRLSSRELHLVPNGIGADFFTFQPSRAESADYVRRHYGLAGYLLCVSRVEPRKQQMLLVDSYLERQLHRRGIPLVLVGEWTLRYPAFARRLRHLPAESKPFIHYFPSLEQADLLHFYRAARVLVYPSRAEGFGMPPLEAAALETPVLCARATAMAEFPFPGAYFFAPDDGDDFRDKLEGLLRHPPDEQGLQELSERIRRTYCWQRSSEIFAGCLADNRAVR